ncbi:helix-turn-helix domain-containing protein [Clostridium magnum]|uniref:Antitoxin HipB n=1 Tax=Clostridium magnum DSM 2767 TaxID=1121326 RepID=A0A161W0M7_9CLOT|nr:helix-turn-helix transcriptional regulator [Clostridium magnum]KZL88660.1 antitoxin HipB [Clostridium magnum DSM 2767]KZL88750.1 antitoxin HipB [Clostridium magnum DSM 2767]
MKVKIVLKDVRIRKGLTQAALSHKSGVAQSHISDIENSIKSPTLDKLCKLAEALEVKLEDLYICFN